MVPALFGIGRPVGQIVINATFADNPIASAALATAKLAAAGGAARALCERHRTPR